jgi:hypothetical protein
MGTWIKTDRIPLSDGGERKSELLNLDHVRKLTIEGDGDNCYLSADGDTIAVGTREQIQTRFNDFASRFIGVH